MLLLCLIGVIASGVAGWFIVPRAAAHKLDKSIAVLPFENFSDSKENAFFADGIQDDVLTNLARVSDLRVISRTSVMPYRGQKHNIREIGKALDVGAILEGSVRREDKRVRAFPGEGLDIPVWILGSSLFGAQLAAMLGLPYAFASHFAPAAIMDAIRVYRERFQPSAQLDRPYVMLGFNVFAADTDEEAQLLATSVQQAVVSLRTGRPTRLPPPVKDYAETLPPGARAIVDNFLTCSAIGSPATVKAAIEEFVARTGADELMITAQIFDHSARLKSYETVAGLFAG